MRNLLHLLLLLLASGLFSLTDAASMSIDLGSEFLKMALVKPGVPMEIVLNRESQRKTPFAVTIREGDRYFGSTSVKKFSATQYTYTFFLDLIGKAFDDPAVEAYQRRFPHLQLKKNEQRNAVVFVTDSGEIPVETLLAMVLANARTEVESYAHQPVKDVVISIPIYFGQPERQAIETAAQIAGLNLYQLLTAGAAAGLNYGVFRYKDIIEQPQNLLIYDVGSTKVQATVIQYRLFNESKENGNGSAAAVPRMEVIGFGFNAQLGGHLITLRLRERLVEAFRKQHPNIGDDITTSPQAMAKLLREADRVKQVLSANSETYAQVESLFQDIDFKAKFTRRELEEIFKEFEQQYLEPINAALEMSQISLENLDRILLMGAGTRVPRLQEILGQFFSGKEIGRNLNTDEAVALGAVYQAARESKKFIVKRFDVVDYKPPETQSPVKLMDEQEVAQAKTILSEFSKREKAKIERDEALNSLESAVYDYSTKMDEEEFTKFGTSEELELVGKQLVELKEWLEEVNDETGADKLKEKKRELLKPIRKMKSRRRQKEERPEYMNKLAKALEGAERQFKLFSNTTEIFTESELDTYSQLVNSTKSWFESAQKEMEDLADNQDATFTIDDLKTKTNNLNREIRFMLNQLMIKVTPPPPPPSKEEEKSENDTASIAPGEEEASVGDGRDDESISEKGQDESNKTETSEGEAIAEEKITVEEVKEAIGNESPEEAIMEEKTEERMTIEKEEDAKKTSAEQEETKSAKDVKKQEL